ncbi:MAG: VCBS domain-containing protein [Gammaproteobacteria bacterium]|nr:VCBS domain-containing protein [Gammaproteobacteria bacterium]
MESFTISLDDQNGGVISKQIDVTITGTNDVPVITAQDLVGGVTELVAPTGSLTDSGTISFSDVDLTDAHLVSAASVGATLGSLTAVKNTDTTGTGTGGQVTWNYTVPASAVESLAAGQTKVESFMVSIDDQKGGVTTTQVDVTITGTNDVPVITAQDLVGGVTELVAPVGNLTDSGAISFSDVDLTDVHLVSATGTPVGTTLGSLTANVSNDTTSSGTGGQVTWNYSVPASAVEFLAAGQTKVESFSISLSDQNGGVVSRQINVVITGTNDVPVITSEDLIGAVKVPVQEVAAPPSPLVFTVQQFLGYQSNDLNTLRNYASSHTANYTVQTNVIDYTDDTGGFAGELPGSSRWPAAVAQGAFGTGGINDGFFARITAEFSVSSADTYTFRTFNDDGVFLLIDNTLVISDTGYHPEVAFNGSIALTPGNHTIELFFFENGGEASLEFSARTSTGSFGLVGGTGGGFGGSLAQVTDSGVITFSDVDLNDAHLVSAAGTPVGTTLGSLSAVKNIDTTGTGTGGQLTWTYTAPSSALVYLGEGQTKVESFTISLNDQHGGLITRQIDVTITGTNEGPVIGTQDLSGALVEQLTPIGVLAESGSIQFTDADLSDVHVASAAPQGSTLGSLTATIGSDTTGTGAGGQLNWQYTVNASAVEYLAANQNKIETFTITLDDQHGGLITKQVDITITGTNDAAIISSAVANLVETNAPLSTGGQLTISDVDSPATFVAQAGTAGAYGVFGINAAGNWTYNTNGALNQLAPGQTVSDVFSVSSADGTSSTVTVNILGTADGPVANDDSSQLTTLVAQTVTGNTVYWADWQSATFLSQVPGSDPTYRIEGAITLPGGHQIGVTYTGQITFAQTNSGTFYYTQPNGPVYTSAAVGNAPSSSDIIALADADTPRTLTFSEPVENLFFAIVSMNNNGYLFDQDFNIVSSGHGYFGNSSNVTKTATNDGRFGISSTGNPSEFHGVLQIDAAIDSLTWNSQAYENWNGFTVGTYGVAQTASVSGNALSNDVANNVGDALHVSAVNGSTISGNSITLTLASSATIKIDKDGDYFYNDNGAFAYLGAGETFTETVQYTAMDSYGGTDNAEIRIVVQGVNDKAVLGTAVTQLVETNSPLSAAGVLSISDLDQGEQVFITQSGTAGAHGVFNINSAGNWSYNTNGAVDDLASGQTVSDVFNVTSADGTATSVTVNILGANDAPVINSGGVVAGAVTEDTTLTVTGLLTASDVDTGATRGWSVAGGGAGSYGSLSVNSSGLWTYNLNNSSTAVQALTTGQTRVENFNVVVTDQYGATDTEAVTITVNGKNESLIVTPLSRSAAEDKIDGSIQTVLFIDDDRGLNGQGTWFSALSANGYSYTYEQIAADGNPTSNLANFDLVIWSVGDQAYTNLTTANVTTLTTYLNGGGRLLYSGGHNVYSEPNITSFAPNYLGISNYQGNMPSVGAATPATGPGGSYTLNSWAGGAYGGTMISAFGATGANTTSLMKLTTGSTYRDVAAVKTGSNFVAGIWSFDINQLGAAYRTDFLGDTLDALGGGFHVDLLTGASDPAGGTLSVTNLKQVSGASVGAIVTGKELSLEASDLLYLTAGQTETLVYEFEVSNGTTTTTNTITIAVSGTNVVPSGVVYDHALVGGTGKDILLGGAGADTLTGGTGADKFVFTASNQGFDSIVDFNIVDDLLVIHATGFGGGLVAGAALAASQLVAAAGAVATQAIGQFLYDTSTGVLSWDQDGTGAAAAIQVVELVGIPALTAADFQVV